MSTRRARIKAIATLPQRRKNINNVDAKKKQDVVELVENEIKSPKVSQRPSADEVVRSSPARKNISSPRRSPRTVRGTPEPDKNAAEQKFSTPTPVSFEKNKTPVQDKTNKFTTFKADVFISPRAPPSPLKLRSPVAKSLILEIDLGVEKHLTPHKRLLELQEKPHKLDKLPESKNEHRKLEKQLVPRSSETSDLKYVDGYNSPNTPETSDVMDGIVPLTPISNAPKPIELLKSEIISENVEVVFDPIVPLPSPTKVRPKLRPVPRLCPVGPIRRNSVPGSASESEDESRRTQGGPSTPGPTGLRHDSQSSHSTLQSLPNRDVSRVRNDSVCSMLSHGAPQTPALLGSPLKEKNVSKSRRQEVSRRMAALRRRKESIQRDKLTMYDLIFYNPLSNPIVPDPDEIKANEASKDEGQAIKAETKSTDTDKSTVTNAAPVPQIKLGPNGEIVLDEQSLVINQSEQRELSTAVVQENAWSTGRVYRRTPRTAEWTDAETVRFYRALAAMGTDFSLMEALFPGRTRRDLKLKFKKEEKVNMPQIDKALRTVAGWDPTRLLKEFTEERKFAEEQKIKEKDRMKLEKQAEKERFQAMKELKVRQSKSSKALGSSILPTATTKSNQCVTANDVISQAIERQKRRAMIKNKNKELRTILQSKRTPQPKIPIPRLPTPTKQNKPAQSQSPLVIDALPSVPANITPGSLVVLTVDDPKAPSQKAIHTYIKQGDGSIKSIVLDSNVMSSLVTLVKKDTPKAGSSISSPSPGSSSRNSTPSVGASPNKRKRLSSYTMTEL